MTMAYLALEHQALDFFHYLLNFHKKKIKSKAKPKKVQ